MSILKDYKRFLKFGLIGLSGVGVNSGILWFLVHLNILPFYFCSFLAIEFSIITNFLLNDIWTWVDKRRGSKWMRLLKYNLATAFSSIFINMTILLFLKEWLGMPYLLANFAGIGFGMLFNFYINHYWTFGTFKLTLPRPVWVITVFSLVWRLSIAVCIGAGFDEAYYYSYALHPALSYFDHPPFVGFLTGFFPLLTTIASPFTIRLGAVLLFTVSGLIVYKTSRLLVNQKEAFTANILFHITPLFMLGAGTMILPDAGLVFFWSITLFFLIQILIKKSFTVSNWIFAGLFTGLAMLSKYHGILLAVGVLLFLIFKYPRQFLKPGIYLYGLSAALIFTPVILWNINNHFISFTFQGARAGGGHLSVNRFFQALGGQTGYITPFIFFMFIFIIIRIIIKYIKKGDNINFFYIMFGVIPVLGMLLLSFYQQILPHWTLPGYIILIAPLGHWLAGAYPAKKSVRIFSWVTIGFIYILLIAAVLHTQKGIFHLEKMAQKGWISTKEAQMDATLDAFGWEKVPQYLQINYPGKELFLFTHKWFLSGEIALAVKGKYPVMCFDNRDSRGFGFWDAKLDMRGKDGLFICSNRYRLDPAKFSNYFQSISQPDSIVIYRGSVPAKTLYFFYCHNLIEKYPLPYGIGQ